MAPPRPVGPAGCRPDAGPAAAPAQLRRCPGVGLPGSGHREGRRAVGGHGRATARPAFVAQRFRARRPRRRRRLSVGPGLLRGGHPGLAPGLSGSAPDQYRHDLPAGGRGGGPAPRTRAGGAGLGGQRRAVRFLLRAAIGLVRRLGRAVPADVRRPADGRAAGRPADRRLAPAGPGRRQARGRCARPLRIRAGAVRGPAAGANRRRGLGIPERRVRRPRRPLHTGPGRPAAAGARRWRRGTRTHAGAMGLRPRPGLRRRHRHPVEQPRAVPVPARAHAGARRAGPAPRRPAALQRGAGAPPARRLRHPDRHRHRTAALCGSRPAGAAQYRIRTPAQRPADGGLARSAHAADQLARHGRDPAALARRHDAGRARNRGRHAGPGAAHARAGRQPAGHGAAAKPRCAAAAPMAIGRGTGGLGPGGHERRAAGSPRHGRAAFCPAAGEMRWHPDRTGAVQPAGKCRQIHAARQCHPHRRPGRPPADLREIRARPARVGPPPAQASGWRYAAPSWTPTRAASGSSRPGACAAPASSSRCR